MPKKGGSRRKKQIPDAMDYLKVEEPSTRASSPFPSAVDVKGKQFLKTVSELCLDSIGF